MEKHGAYFCEGLLYDYDDSTFRENLQFIFSHKWIQIIKILLKFSKKGTIIQFLDGLTIIEYYKKE